MQNGLIINRQNCVKKVKFKFPAMKYERLNVNINKNKCEIDDFFAKFLKGVYLIKSGVENQQTKNKGTTQKISTSEQTVEK